MITRIIKDGGLEYASETLKNGGLCVVPTETVYGVAANGLDANAIERLYEVKNRPDIKPIQLLVSSLDQSAEFTKNVPPDAKRLETAFMPGPLTLVLHKSNAVPVILTAGLSRVALRIPAHEKTLELLRLCGTPLACTSANVSGSGSPKTFEGALRFFDGKVEAAIDGGDCVVGRESTVLDMTAYPYRILRRGGLSKRKIAVALGQKIDGLTLIGITGGSGAGKTTALKALSKMGALVIDCDAVYRELTENDTLMLAELNMRFPGVAENGKLDRRALAAIVFTDKTALAELNKITHSYVDREVMRRISAFASDGGKIAAVDAIALVESRLSDICDINAAVISPKNLRLKRVMLRDNITEELAELRLSAQQPDEFYTANCELILRNEFPEEAGFLQYCEKIFKQITEDI